MRKARMASGLCLSKTSTAASRVYIYTRDQLVSGQGLSYAYDDIGNRIVAEGKTYVANALNQYTKIDDFTPQYDADGNQTLIQTATGIWHVTYNAENRPVRWESGDTVITMAFDRLGRRVYYCETRAGQAVTHFRFVYDNFLCVQRLDAANDNAVRTEFVWDPTEPIATRPLVFQPASGETAYYFHDGNKNVSEVFYHALQDGIAAHYDYAPFGAVTRTARATRVTNRDLLSENPFRFSSEYYDSTLALTYYNYRHYVSLTGAFLSRDPVEEYGQLYSLVKNMPINLWDLLGLSSCPSETRIDIRNYSFWIEMASGYQVEGSLRKYFQETIGNEIKETIKSQNPDAKTLIEGIESVTRKIKDTVSFADSIYFFLTSTGPYIRAWNIILDVRLYYQEDCNQIYSDKSFSYSKTDQFYNLYNRGSMQSFAADLATVTVEIIKDIEKALEAMKQDD